MIQITPHCAFWLGWSLWTEGRGSILWRRSAGRNLPPIRFPAACLSSATAARGRSGSWPMTARGSGYPPSACPRDAFVVANGRGSGPQLARASGPDAAGGRRSGNRSRTDMAACERMKNRGRHGLGFQFPFCRSYDRWQRWSGNTGAGWSRRKTSNLSESSSHNIRVRAGADYRRDRARRGSGSRPTARYATWCAAACC